jgi:hypothetical protein
MISAKHQCIFVHIPKTGGQSIESVFLKLSGLDWESRAPLLLRLKEPHEDGPERLAHLTAREYVALRYIDAESFNSFFKFAFVRNPWDRLVSEYRYLKEQVPFAAFAERVLADDYSDASRHIRPQVEFVTDDGGATIVDFIGRFESIQKDFAEVAHRLGLGRVKLPHRNSSGLFRRGYRHYYDLQLRERVRQFYAADIERFGYSF